jgi:hypothetical protein
VPYSGTTAAGLPSLPEQPQINDNEAYRTNLTRWLDGDDARKGDARQFFWQAFMGSEIVENIEEIEYFGSGQRRSRHEFRKAHQFLLATLTDGLSDGDFKGVLDLLLSCGSGLPYPLAELLVRYGRRASVFRQWMVCHVLGEIGSAPHECVREFLETRAHSASWPIRLESALARFKSFVKDEGAFRISHQGQMKRDYATVESSLLTLMSAPEQLICRLAFASILRSPGVGSLVQPFESNYAAIQSQIETLCLPFLKDDEKKSKATTLKLLIQTHDYVGVCVLVALDLDGGEQHPLHSTLLDTCCNGSIVTAGHDQASRHLAMVFLLKKQHRIAFEIAAGLASRNPDWLDVQILVAEILGDTPGAEEEAAQRIASIRRTYKLTGVFEMRVAAVETEVTKRKGSL